MEKTSSANNVTPPLIKINEKKSILQTKITINNIDIFFPYQPYPNQITYMQKVIDSLNNQDYAALESPTGTGKTLCLLCASLAWLKHAQDNHKVKPNQKIYYTSRTHSQLQQVIKELKKTCYEPTTSILSSRDNLCVNVGIKDATGDKKNLLCRKLKRTSQCKFANGVDHIPQDKYNICDIEDLYTKGCSQGFCPFYFQRNKISKCNIVFMPYNYIFESDIRNSFDLSLENVIILIDEAHNMNNVCESGVSCELSESILQDCINDLQNLYNEMDFSRKKFSDKSALNQVNKYTLNDEINIVKNLKKYLLKFNIKKGQWPNRGLVLKPKDLFEFFFEGSKLSKQMTLFPIVNEVNTDDYSSITPKNMKNHLNNLEAIIKGIHEDYEITTRLSDYVKVLGLVQLLYANYEVFKNTNQEELYVNSFTFFINYIEQKNNNPKQELGLFFYCFNPGFGFRLIERCMPYNIIITSGTLSPISGIESELKCEFPVQLENSHVASNEQINFSIITKSYGSQVEFKFDKTNRDNKNMIDELGMTILELCKCTPGGILIFFPSYSYMNDCYSNWITRNDIIEDISNYKTIYKDKQNTKESKEIVRMFKECNSKKNNRKGGLMLSVCRGSSSEGIDFADDYARMVIVVGIPYANLGSDKVQLKKEFLDKYKYDPRLKATLTGSQWYVNDAILSVNQSLGRVIRHKEDYGSMVVIDGRYGEMLNKKLFSGWLNKCGKIYYDNQYINDIQSFYSKMKDFALQKKLEKETSDVERMKLKWSDWQQNTTVIDLSKEEDEENERKSKWIYYNTADKKSSFINPVTPANKEENDDNADNNNNEEEDDNNKDKYHYTYFDYLKTPSDEKNHIFLNNKRRHAVDNSILKTISSINTLQSNPSVQKTKKTLTEMLNSTIKKPSVSANKIKINQSIMNYPSQPKTLDSFFSLRATRKVLPSSSSSHNAQDIPIVETPQRDKMNAFLKAEEEEIRAPESTESKSEEMIQMLLRLKEQSNSSYKNLINKFNDELAENDKDDVKGMASIDECEEYPKRKTKYECPVCFDNSVDNRVLMFSSSKCGHILCNDCWEKSLQNRLECPLCKHKVRSNTLIKLVIT